MTPEVAAVEAELSVKVAGILRGMSSALTDEDMLEIALARDVASLDRLVDKGHSLVAEAALAAFLLSLARQAPTVHDMLVPDTSGWRINEAQSRLRTGIIAALGLPQKELIRLVFAGAAGVAASVLAVRLRNALGLTEHHYASVDQYEKLLAVPSRREVDRKQGTSWQQIAVMTGVQARRKRDERAGRIAHAEAVRAAGRAELEAWLQASERALVSRGAVRRTWNCSHKDSRHSHMAAHGQERGLDDAFDVGANQMMYPGDSSAPASEVMGCSCWLTYRQVL